MVRYLFQGKVNKLSAMYRNLKIFRAGFKNFQAKPYVNADI